MAFPYNKLRVAAIADLHCTAASQGSFQQLFSEITSRADVLLMCGDLTNYGLPEEARVLAREITAAIKIPVLAVLGNHDVESGRADVVKETLSRAGVEILDGDSRELHGVGFAGVKGFAGGFGDHMLQAWGEESIKRFVHETVEESLKLEAALARLSTPQRVVLLHYSPIVGTLDGEPREIYPYLGSSRLEDPLDRFPVTAVFHGHAHHGAFEGRTRGGKPVYNVALSVLRRRSPERPPYHLLEIPLEAPVA